MSKRVPGVKQYERLQTWARVGQWLVVGREADHGPLIRNGWLEQDPDCKDDNPLTFLRITPDGLRAVAAAIEKHGRPSFDDIARRHPAPDSDKESGG